MIKSITNQEQHFNTFSPFFFFKEQSKQENHNSKNKHCAGYDHE